MKRLVICLFNVFVFGTTAYAESVKGLYEAIVPIQGQAAENRVEAIEQAFSLVLVKVSGVSDISNRPEMLSKAQRYVEQYRYQWVPNGASKQAEGKRVLWVKFDKLNVDPFLLEAGFPVWGEDRPSILSWMGIDEGGSRTLSNDAGHWVKIKNVGERRGLSFLFPLMDLEDQTDLQFSDVWGDFETSIRTASKRYEPDGILVSRITNNAESWSGRWTLYLGDSPIRWEAKGQSLEALLMVGIDRSVDFIAQQYAAAVNLAENSKPSVIVSDVLSLTDYARVLHYLSNLTQVEKVQPMVFSENRVKFFVTLVGDPDSLVKAVRIGGVLDYVPTFEGSQGLNFVLLP